MDDIHHLQGLFPFLLSPILVLMNVLPPHAFMLSKVIVEILSLILFPAVF
jgi:hypothetical protein